MKIQGNLLKMSANLANPIQYQLILSGEKIEMNSLLGQKISLHYLNQINCIKCGRKTSKSFAQGFCFPCFRSAPETEECVLRPEMCQAQDGIARDLEFANNHCLIDHFVYLAFTSGLKVGVTRNTQIPTRWIDQGAISAIILARTPNRYIAGCIEVAMKKHFNDKTNWRNMLKGTELNLDLVAEKRRASELVPENYQEFLTDDSDPVTLEYPSISAVEKIKSISLDKTPSVDEKLIAIKGQYLIFESGNVFNIRKHNGYLVEFSS